MTTEIRPTELLTPAEAAARLGVAVGTLAVWRCKKRYGLVYRKMGSKVRYTTADIERFIEKRAR